MTRALLVCMHAYTPFGIEFYEPILDFFLASMKKYQDEYDMIYLIEDDNWRINPEKLEWMKAKILHIDSSLRYYDAYKQVLPLVTEDLVLFLDDDMIIYKPGIIDKAFKKLDEYDVVSITDTIGSMKVPLKTGNKLCPYFFAARKDLLMKYLDIDWGPDAMPYTETFGLLTEALLKDDYKVYEMEDDKSNILFNGTKDDEKGKDLGYYHIRAGSTVAYLLATKAYGDKKTYEDYLNNQPRSELLRHCAWYVYTTGMSKTSGHVSTILKDLNITPEVWHTYFKQFREYHRL